VDDGSGEDRTGADQPAPVPEPGFAHEPGYTLPPAWQPRPPGEQPRPGAFKRALAPLAAVAAAGAKWGAVLVKLKAFTLFGSVAVSIAAYTWLFGFTFALGFVALILVHEMGHFVLFAVRGLRPKLPVFIPLLGAYTSAELAPADVYDEALSGLAGPFAGMAASGLVGWYGQHTGSAFLYALAYVGFFLNLFNLLPLLPLDGGHAAAALHPGLSAVGLAVLLAVEIRHPSPLLLLILLFGGYQTWRRYKGSDAEAVRRYRSLRPDKRLRVGLLYAALVAAGVWGSGHFYIKRTF
jgi:Zn-dependent protease